MKITAVFRVAGHYRFAEPIIRELARDNEITLVLPDPDKLKANQTEGLQVEKAPSAVAPATVRMRDRRDTSLHFMWVRSGIQTEEMIEHFYQHLPKQAVPTLRSLYKKGFSRPLAPFYLAYVKLREKLSGPDPVILAHLKELAPDLLFVCPGVYPSIGVGPETDYVKAAKYLGLPTVALVSSWDNLTSKSTFHLKPDKVMVWNEVQVSEARRFHGLQEGEVEAIGAAVFDKMFTKEHWQDRETFCANVGLDPSRPFVLWAGTSRAACADERKVVEGLIAAMRTHPGLNRHQVLVRPHPKFGEAFRKWSAPDVAIWRTPGFPDDDEATKGLYNCLAHAESVAGLSTSVFLEAAALDRPCALLKHSVYAPESIHGRFAHFESLMQQGYPSVTEDEKDCAKWFAEIAEGRDPSVQDRHAFVRSFLRPRGMETPAAQVGGDIVRNLMKGRRSTNS